MVAQTMKQTLVDSAYERLKREILENRLPSGFQAPEPEIALRLGMSRTPVREALIRLEADGLVELVPRRGVRVLPVSPDDMREIYEILTALEPEAAARIARTRPDFSQLKPLFDATMDMERAIAASDLDAWARADDLFHRRLLELNNNKRLNAMVNNLYDQAHRARMITLRLRDLPVRSTEDHREILEQMAAGHADRVRDLFRDHRERAASELLSILEKYRLPQL